MASSFQHYEGGEAPAENALAKAGKNFTERIDAEPGYLRTHVSNVLDKEPDSE